MVAGGLSGSGFIPCIILRSTELSTPNQGIELPGAALALTLTLTQTLTLTLTLTRGSSSLGLLSPSKSVPSLPGRDGAGTTVNRAYRPMASGMRSTPEPTEEEAEEEEEEEEGACRSHPSSLHSRR